MAQVASATNEAVDVGLKRRPYPSELNVLAGLIVIAVIFEILGWIFQDQSFIFNLERLKIIILQVSIVGIIAVGVTQVIISGGIDLSVGSVVALTTMIAASLLRAGAPAGVVLPLVLLIGALFGSLLLLPLYYQLVRHESPLHVGLLLVPQGVGAALAMPVAGVLTDRLGARVVVSTGIVVAALGTLAYTQVGAHTSYLALALALFVVGLGIGSTIVPSMAAAYQTLAREETPRATSALNAIQRVAGAIGTALLAIVLQRAIAGDVPGFHGGIQAMAALSRQPSTTPLLAQGFGTTFWVAGGLIAAALAPALLLPRAERAQPHVGSKIENAPGGISARPPAGEAGAHDAAGAGGPDPTHAPRRSRDGSELGRSQVDT
jgi:Na+/melibiose symporter-like transporter